MLLDLLAGWLLVMIETFYNQLTERGCPEDYTCLKMARNHTSNSILNIIKIKEHIVEVKGF